MSLDRRWVARCDDPGCDAVLVVPPAPGDMIGGDAKWIAGIYVADEGWEAAPSRREVYCPRHHTEDYQTTL